VHNSLTTNIIAICKLHQYTTQYKENLSQTFETREKNKNPLLRLTCILAKTNKTHNPTTIENSKQLLRIAKKPHNQSAKNSVALT